LTTDTETAAHRDAARLSADGIDDRHATAGRLLVIAFLAHFLIVLAAWTVTIKFLFPIAYALRHGVPVGTYIYWDFWWVAHLWLAWALLRWQPYTYALAVCVSGVEIAIIVAKFALFLAAPKWTIWTANWFINKLFVLACFCLMLAYFGLYRRDLCQRPRFRGASGLGDPEAAQR
jgi:hypothetical protein